MKPHLILRFGHCIDYDGAFLPEKWTRLAFSFTDLGTGSSRLGKFVDGVLVDQQVVGAGRHRLDPTDGVLIMTDNDDETFKGRIATFALVDRAVTDDEIELLGGATPGGIFQRGSEGVTEFDFTGGISGGILTARIGTGSLIARSVKSYSEDAGIVFAAEGPVGGLSLETDYGTGATSYSLIFDLYLYSVQPGGFGGLLQTDGQNLSDGGKHLGLELLCATKTCQICL